ncbi:peptidase associated/transthyretin-like domain-containing protein [Cellulomonas alba]|uniref:Carboxypeptidase regulatory-like domain-containing protein n=1 Tax=Cellulomonas alba TaxID=3053467 RepID=A0ABT7SDS9_9CELL|nr:carboxypeptidase regulatory-like domain-containing protein [Cellulomonas alba]MDM7854348.1 carboxypeptidase regulatory-like domain-containing protein [Cellulomonas alba]
MTAAEDRELALVAAGGIDAEDRAILGRLAALVEATDPVPPGLVDRIGLALTMEALHAEIAELHLVGEPALAVRADETSIEAGTITFTTDVLTVMISVHPEGGRVRVDGWAAPAGEISVELHQGGDVTTTQSDADGRFSFADVERGPARLVLRRPSDPTVPIVTPQIEL